MVTLSFRLAPQICPTEEFNMIHPPGVISKYAPESIIGRVGAAAAVAAAPAAAAPAAGGGDQGTRV